jgi:excisionase family DNA binding protein
MTQSAQKDHFSPKQIGQALGVSEASVKRWCDQGKIESVRTAGGHRRVPVSSIVAYLRETDQPLVEPGVLGLPAVRGSRERSLAKSRDSLETALEAGDSDQAVGLVVNLYVGGHAAVEICDQCVAPVFHSIGDRWECGSVDVYQERRACQIAMRFVHRLRELLPPVPASGAVACGGTIRGDRYTLATIMVELALREVGWQAQSYGSDLPVDTLVAALEKDRPRLFWLSVSAIESPEEFLHEYGKLYKRASALGVPVVVGGRALTKEFRREMVYTTFCDTLRQLTAFAETLLR